MRHLFVPLIFLFAGASAQSVQETFDSLVTSKLVGQSPGGVVLVAKKGRIIYQKAYGMANLEQGTPMDVNHVFRIGSITKQFTAIAVLQLAEHGKLSLQDSVAKFIRDYPARGASVTIEQLLTHTSGTKNLTGLAVWTPELMRREMNTSEVIDLFKNEPLDFEPGSQFRYSNSGYILLGKIIEAATGASYADYLRDNLFRPAGMSYTHYDSATRVVAHRVSGYQRKQMVYENAQLINMSLPFGAGGLMSTANDLLKWNEALLHANLVTGDNLHSAQTDHRLKDGKSSGYGYGWEVGNVQGSASVKHAGRINGFVTFALCVPAEDIFVAILTNCDCVDNLEAPASLMAGIVLGKPYRYDVVAIPQATMKACEGIYQSEERSSKYISFEDGRLLFYEKGGMKRLLTPVGKDQFHLENELTTVQFHRDKGMKVVGLTINDTGIPTTWKRSQQAMERVTVVKVKPSELTKYTGDYQFSPGPVFTVSQEGGRIFGAVGTDKKEILCYGNHSFIAKDLDAKIVFDVDKKGNVVGLRKIQSDEMKAAKIR